MHNLIKKSRRQSSAEANKQAYIYERLSTGYSVVSGVTCVWVISALAASCCVQEQYAIPSANRVKYPVSFLKSKRRDEFVRAHW